MDRIENETCPWMETHFGAPSTRYASLERHARESLFAHLESCEICSRREQKLKSKVAHLPSSPSPIRNVWGWLRAAAVYDRIELVITAFIVIIGLVALLFGFV